MCTNTVSYICLNRIGQFGDHDLGFAQYRGTEILMAVNVLPLESNCMDFSLNIDAFHSMILNNPALVVYVTI